MNPKPTSQIERIAKALGGIVFDNGRRALVRGPGHGADDRSVSLAETEDGRILIHCFSPRDDWRGVRDDLRARGLLNPAAEPSDAPTRQTSPTLVVQPQAEDRSLRARRWWEEGRSLPGTPAAAYLRARHIAAGLESEALRFHARVTSLDDRQRRPALLAAIDDADGGVQGVQATLLSAHGAGKAIVATPRRVIGRLLGGAVRLFAAAETLVIGEGVESALSAGEALKLPAWAALSAHNLSLFSPPPNVTHLVAAPDNDAAGAKAWEILRERLAPALRVERVSPPEGFNDWNDWARAHRG